MVSRLARHRRWQRPIWRGRIHRPACLTGLGPTKVDGDRPGPQVQVASPDSELHAEIARLRHLLEREKLDSRRGEEQIRFQARLLDAVHEAVIATDPSGVVLYWNHFAEGLYGWTADEAVGRNILELTPAEEDLRDAEAVLARLRRGEPWSGEITLRRRDGSSFPGHVSDAPVYDDAGRLIAIVGISYTSASERRPRRSRRSWCASFTTA
jgi:PAS domain S-box-containing protein